MRLDEAAFDAPVRVAEILSEDSVELARLSALGLRAGAVVVKLMPTPLRDPVSCLVGSQLLALERRLLRRVRVDAA
ncbi:MAG: ferrous iron transport protein A [Elusimicrobia bacterium]|nr:ferrous iron transport protein A [Elusimicrobiota bacterium]